MDDRGIDPFKGVPRYGKRLMAFKTDADGWRGYSFALEREILSHLTDHRVYWYDDGHQWMQEGFRDWMDEHMTGLWFRNSGSDYILFAFENERDAVLFRLRYGGTV